MTINFICDLMGYFNVLYKNKLLNECYIYCSFVTRVSQLKIWHFLVIDIERNIWRCTFNRYSFVTQFAKLTAGEQLCCHCTHRKL